MRLFSNLSNIIVNLNLTFPMCYKSHYKSFVIFIKAFVETKFTTCLSEQHCIIALSIKFSVIFAFWIFPLFFLYRNADNF